jgi:MbtH protein
MMNRDEKEDKTIYQVVVNHEEQYSIRPEYKGEPPLGWRKVGKSGLKGECLIYIKEVWTDMRPLSLREKMKEIEKEEARRREEAKKRPMQ